MYNSKHGRFTSVDPLKDSSTANDPQSWNRYTYTYKNPLNYVDPTGLVAMDDYYIDREKTRVRPAILRYPGRLRNRRNADLAPVLPVLFVAPVLFDTDHFFARLAPYDLFDH